MFPDSTRFSPYRNNSAIVIVIAPATAPRRSGTREVTRGRRVVPNLREIISPRGTASRGARDKSADTRSFKTAFKLDPKSSREKNGLGGI